jgi:putative nucleotidyltransferase with HDIG domain
MPLENLQSFGAGRVIVVDDDDAAGGMILRVLEEEGYDATLVPSADAALDLARSRPVELVISDVKMPGRDGLWLLGKLRDTCPDTAVIMVTGYGETSAAVECLREGATDYLLKPPRPTELVIAAERALSRRRLELARQNYRRSLEARVRDRTSELQRALRDLETTYATTLWALVAALDAREQETSNHSQRVVRYTLAMAARLGLPAEDHATLARGALLHDLGKIGVPDAILMKPGRLTEAEWAEMRRHPQIGSDILRAIPFLEPAAEIVLAHQERLDGTGYPRGLAGDEIPLGARIFAVADTFDAITSDRPYRRRASIEAARAEVARCAGTQFDARCAEVFLDIPPEDLMELARPTPAPPM